MPLGAAGRLGGLCEGRLATVVLAELTWSRRSSRSFHVSSMKAISSSKVGLIIGGRESFPTTIVDKPSVGAHLAQS